MENMNIQNVPTPISPAAMTGREAPKTQEQHAIARMERVVESNETEKLRNNNAAKDPEEARFDAVKKAAEREAQTISQAQFPVSDVRFTIYREKLAGSGDFQYITRVTSLRDGEVTVIPERDMFADLYEQGGVYFEDDV